jgi:two-component system NtrC family response regulator
MAPASPPPPAPPAPPAPSPRARILVVEDDASLRRIAEYRLTEAGYEVRLEADGLAGLRAFAAAPPDLVVTDLRMPGGDGESLYEEILRRDPATPVVVMTGHGTVEGAVRALKRGVANYIAKPVSWDEMLVVVAKELERAALRRENLRLRGALKERFRVEGLVGASAAVRAVQETVARLVDAEVPVLLEGESGTGKELVARALHFQGRRAAGPFVPVNCAAIPRDLVESELFGHEAGAFTGAHRAHRGFFEQAHGGTIFLDEVGEIPLAAQPALLRVLAEKRVRKVGGEGTVAVDVRVVAATNRDLKAAVDEGDFRTDLYFRLAVVPIRLPPLRERGEDVLLLARHFAARGAGREVQFTGAAEDTLRRHAWTGNVRELENVVARALLLASRRDVIDAPELGLATAPPAVPPADAGAFPADGVDLAQIERDWIRRALEHTRGNRSRAARLLGISRQTLLYRIEKHAIDIPPESAAEPPA